MKKVLKKNQVIITSLAILIAVAGYLNFADMDFGGADKAASADGSSILDGIDYDLTDEAALVDENTAAVTDTTADTGTPGEAVLTAAGTFAAQAKLSREQIRSQNKADLQEIINNSELADDQKQEAVSSMVSMADITEKEAAAELLLEAKGFSNVVVNLTGETADVVVPKENLGEVDRAQIEDIVKRKTGIAPENIVITPLNSAEEEELADKDAGLNADGSDSGSADSAADAGLTSVSSDGVSTDAVSSDGSSESSTDTASGDTDNSGADAASASADGYTVETDGIYD